MKLKPSGLSSRYVTALKKFLRAGAGSDLRSALALGRHAVRLRLETLELARIHEEALVTLALATGAAAQVKRAELFFAEAITPIVETHIDSRQNKSELNRMNAILQERTAELAVTNRRLKEGVARRKTVEASLRKSGRHYARLVKDSSVLAEDLRVMTRQALAAQEEERKKVSAALQNDVAQTLLGINVRLLTLKRRAYGNARELKKEITSAQRLVGKTVRSNRRVGGGLRNA